MYFMTKDEIFFDKYMKICQKVSNIIEIKKHLIVSLYIIKNIQKREKKFTTKESFECFYIPVILIHSVYRKDENYYPKIYLENFFIKFSGEV